MRLAYVCADFDVPLYGPEGCSIHARSLIEGLGSEGHDVSLLFAALGDAGRAPEAARVHPLGEEFERTAAWRAVEYDPALWERQLERDVRSVAFNVWLPAAALPILEDERPDAIYERYSLFGTGGLELARRLGIPLIVELNAPLCREQAGYEKFVLTDAAERIEREVLASADAVLAVSPWLRDHAVALGAVPERVHVVPNGVDGRAFEGATAAGTNVRARHGLGDRSVIGYVGSFQPWHDVAGLIEAFAGLRRRHPEAVLLLVGDGPDRGAAARAAEQLEVSDSVVMTGHLPHSQAPEYVGAMDVAVAPYAAGEDFYFSPIKLFEYMAAARPTVAAAIGQIAEVIDDGETGLLYEPGSRDHLTRALEALLRDPLRAAAIGSNARRAVLAERTWDAVARRVAQITGDACAAPLVGAQR